jgi:hypothetical protein
MLEIYAIRMMQNGVEYWFQHFYDPTPLASLHQEQVIAIWSNYLDQAKLFAVGDDPHFNWEKVVESQHECIARFMKQVCPFCEWPIEKVRVK